MTFDDVLEQIIQLLQRQGRVSYRALKRRFALDDDYLEDLKEELIHAQRLATDEEGRILSGPVTPGRPYRPSHRRHRQPGSLMSRQSKRSRLPFHQLSLPLPTPNAVSSRCCF